MYRLLQRLRRAVGSCRRRLSRNAPPGAALAVIRGQRGRGCGGGCRRGGGSCRRRSSGGNVSGCHSLPLRFPGFVALHQQLVADSHEGPQLLSQLVLARQCVASGGDRLPVHHGAVDTVGAHRLQDVRHALRATAGAAPLDISETLPVSGSTASTSLAGLRCAHQLAGALTDSAEHVCISLRTAQASSPGHWSAACIRLLGLKALALQVTPRPLRAIPCPPSRARARGPALVASPTPPLRVGVAHRRLGGPAATRLLLRSAVASGGCHLLSAAHTAAAVPGPSRA